MKLNTAVLTAIATWCALLALATPPASAGDPGACAFNGRYIIGHREYQCTLWRGNVPVYSSYSTGSRVVGYLYSGGRANWFLWQCYGNRAWYGRYYNGWWSYTLADNGRWGYVPLTYFAGGGNNQRSSFLPFNEPSARCGGAPTHPS